jgi:hypothetical protein
MHVGFLRFPIAERRVRNGTIWTAAGVAAGMGLAPALAARQAPAPNTTRTACATGMPLGGPMRPHA